MNRTLTIAALALFTAGAALSQQMTVRDRYYQTGGSAHNGPNVWAGFRTSILLRTGDPQKPAECKFQEVSEAHEFHKGDHFRVRVQANVTGYLYLVSADSQGGLKLLYPDAKGADATSRMNRMDSRWIPASDWFVFDDNTGNERLYLFMSAKPMKEMERLISNAGRKLKDQDLDKMLDKADANPSMISEESGPDGDVGATYYVAQANWSKDSIVRRFRLKHR